MSGLGELELRLLSLLEELGSENVPALMNMAVDVTGRRDDVAMIQDAARNLLKQGHVDLIMESEPAGEIQLGLNEALAEVDALVDHLYFKSEGGYWSDDRMKGPPYFQIPVPELARTALGLTVGEQVLEERGAEWWLRRDRGDHDAVAD